MRLSLLHRRIAAATVAWSAISYGWAVDVSSPPVPPLNDIAAPAVDTHEFTLANGMRVIVKEDHRAPTVAHMVWYRVGSIDEWNGNTGVAHVLEHMMFKGTRTVPAGEFSRRVAALGGRENAFTGKDYTAYFQQIEKSHLADVMALEADRMANLQVAKAEFDKEIRVVMEERRMRTDDDARSLLHEQLVATAFTASPYRRPIAGWMNDLENMSYQDAAEWYARWYTPANAVLVVAGDVDPQQVKVLAEQYYGPIAAKSLPVRKPQLEPAQRGLRRVNVRAPAESPFVLLAFKVPKLEDVEHDVDPYALEVLAGILDGYANSRLSRNLVRAAGPGGRIADEVGAEYSSLGRGPQLFMLEGSPAQGRTTAELEQALRNQIAEIARQGITEAELQRVKAQVMASEIYKRDSVFGQAMEIGGTEMVGFSWRQSDRMLEKMQAVTAEQVKAVAAKYFQDDNLTVASLLPQPIDADHPRPSPSSSALLH